MAKTKSGGDLDLVAVGKHDFDFEITCKRFKTWLIAKHKQNPHHGFDFDFETTCKRFKNWVSKQHLPTINPKEAFLDLFSAAGAAYSMGLYGHRLIRLICDDFGFPQPSPQSQFLSMCGGRYRPLLESFLARGHGEAGTNVALMMACNTGISFLMNNIRGGKEDVHTSLVAGFGWGLMISLVRGVRGPSVLPAAALCALLNAGFYKMGLGLYRIKL
ncbi:hypothetical protein SSX86_012730 [Deinandra increscens subsp. villosa]|uniref:Uncharacterized protein n=1 Tax=Deinandra increscens subsp. villosa TaxID=3103831 RepID=A0AAP0D954_9ASTR